MKRALGVCYYPEHWPRAMWDSDTARMVEAGITWVRIGEFAWSRLEPVPGDMQFGWLDDAIDVLGAAGLKVVLGTPTATPPRWMLDRHPDMLAHDAQGRPRGSGSRRHYCFSHEGYRAECVRIATLLAERYGRNETIQAWQTDNEYGCHDTTHSYSPAARAAFQAWLARKYVQIQGLNAAWGNVFWSMEYRDFAEVSLPNLTVTEPNPAHVMDFRRFSSDQVVAFNRAQTEAIHAHSDAPIIHNYMGRIVDFDHYEVGADLEIASWDSYPLGFLEDRIEADDAYKMAFARQGDPDFQAFHHDLYRTVGRGRWWVMEQQPGPVNWAPYNPAPLPGMVRLWAWEAFAHGAEVVSYFRWRQAPFAQEQMHAGLLRPDDQPAPGLAEATQVAREIAEMPDVDAGRAEVALVFDYESAWAVQTQPQGADQDYFALVFATYQALRRTGVNIDVVGPDTDWSAYKLVTAPGLMIVPASLQNHPGLVILGPRAGAKTPDFAIPATLPPDIKGLDCRIAAVESLRPDMPVALIGGGAFYGWFEHLEGSAKTLQATADGRPAVVRSANRIYIAGAHDADALDRLFSDWLAEVGIDIFFLPQGIRQRTNGRYRYIFNYTTETTTSEGRTLAPASVTVVACGVNPLGSSSSS
ncbi:MAG: beta-galactosidase [Pseudomonadota bacterium]